MAVDFTVQAGALCHISCSEMWASLTPRVCWQPLLSLCPGESRIRQVPTVCWRPMEEESLFHKLSLVRSLGWPELLPSFGVRLVAGVLSLIWKPLAFGRYSISWFNPCCIVVSPTAMGASTRYHSMMGCKMILYILSFVAKSATLIALAAFQ